MIILKDFNNFDLSKYFIFIVTGYNNSEYILKTLTSIKNQVYDFKKSESYSC